MLIDKPLSELVVSHQIVSPDLHNLHIGVLARGSGCQSRLQTIHHPIVVLLVHILEHLPASGHFFHGWNFPQATGYGSHYIWRHNHKYHPYQQKYQKAGARPGAQRGDEHTQTDEYCCIYDGNKHHYTDPEQVEDFITRTGLKELWSNSNCAGSLAIAIGTSHGAYKFKVEKEEDIPELRFDILQDVRKRLGKFPIVLHGSSSVLKKYVDMINQNGGALEKAFGIPEEQLRKATQFGVSKINIDTDGRLVVTAMVRKYLAEHPNHFDPRQYLGPARQELIEMIKRKNNVVLGSASQANYIN